MNKIMIELKPGESYLAVRCKNCDTEFAFLHEKGDGPTWSIIRSTFLLVCPACHEQYEYEIKDAERVQGR